MQPDVNTHANAFCQETPKPSTTLNAKKLLSPMAGPKAKGKFPHKPIQTQAIAQEIAVAQMMEGMKTYVETGKEVYPLEEALQDTYLFLMMDEAAKEGKEIQTQDQCWKKQ